MTANVADNALLLEVLAGPDGLDARQHQVPRVDKYTEALRQGVKGLRIGVLKEGFGHPNAEPDVDAKVRAAAERFKSLGAIVEDVSVPEHLTLGFPVWAAIRGDAACVTLLEMNGFGLGYEGLYPLSAIAGGDEMARPRRRIRRHAEDRHDLLEIHARPLRRALLRQGAEPAAAAARGL